MLQSLYKRLDEVYPDMVSWRRHFHKYPELSFEEVQTPNTIADFYKELGLPYRTGVGGRGVVAELHGAKPGRTVALRADFDALPIQDQKEVDYRSQVPGVMHACGHDAHTAVLMTVARVLKEVREQLTGTIVFIHQYAEEITPGGARSMIEDGCLDGVDAIFGTHLWTDDPVGTVGCREGHLMASVDEFKIEIQGKGGHGAAPHQTADPIVAASQLISQLQTIISRNLDPLHAGVLTIGSIHAGDSFNIIPEKAELQGTVRAFDETDRRRIKEKIEAMLSHICSVYEASYDIRIRPGYPSLKNDAQAAQTVMKAAQHVVGTEKAFEKKPVMAGEDFAYYLKEVPGAYFFTGAGNPDVGAGYPHHHARFDIDERAMPIAAKTLITTALNDLQKT